MEWAALNFFGALKKSESCIKSPPSGGQGVCWGLLIMVYHRHFYTITNSVRTNTRPCRLVFNM
jgi:hypothetical protein